MSGMAFAQEAEAVYGRSVPGQLDMQTPVTQVARQVQDLHTGMLYTMIAICVFVLALLAIVVLRFNAKSNPTPASWTHNTKLEMVWTFVPVVILFIIAIPSFKLLTLQEDFEKVEPDLVIKATGYQWYWGYEYPDADIVFDSYMLGLGATQMNDDVRDELAEYGHAPELWKLAVDNPMVVPVNKTVLVQTTGADVIHSWTVPSFGVKADSVPGRLNQTWFNVERVGTFYGQCSELCGVNHSYMPIAVRVVPQEQYDAWVACVQETDEPAECVRSELDEATASSGAIELAQQ
ncbi:MAG: cytochrome c oxidase subunit II [Neomegalonema sp.]|nr:cytochrome c oxidase subunit II [Neomegalonema sp.]